MTARKTALMGLLSIVLLGGLSGCGKTPVTEDPRHDVQTEARREEDCSNPQWKAANLGLWYNICPSNGR